MPAIAGQLGSSGEIKVFWFFSSEKNKTFHCNQLSLNGRPFSGTGFPAKQMLRQFAFARAGDQSCKFCLDTAMQNDARGYGAVPVLVTGVAGFIGFHTAQRLLLQGMRVIGIDNFNDYYDVRLKESRVAQLKGDAFTLHRADIADLAAISAIFRSEPDITHVIHLAAQAGVRYSMQNPCAYVHSNVMGHLVILEAARSLKKLRHLVYASSSSVYGLGRQFPLREDGDVDHPTSLYAATKRADELISYAYSHLYRLPQTGLRFFTVYGPWGRPDMAYYGFAQAIVTGQPITLYEGGALRRDFTFVDDVVSGVVGVLDSPPPPGAPVVLNIGNNRSESVSHLVALLERELGRTAIIQAVPRPLADVIETWASIDRIAAVTGYAPTTPLDVGIPLFVKWFKHYHGV